MRQPLKQSDLDAFTCAGTDCEEKHDPVMVLAPSCHPRSSLIVSYTQAAGVLTLLCDECSDGIAEILVAK